MILIFLPLSDFFITMTAHSEGGVKNLQKWLMSFMDTPKIYTICQIPDKFYTDNLLLLFLPFLPGETPNA